MLNPLFPCPCFRKVLWKFILHRTLYKIGQDFNVFNNNQCFFKVWYTSFHHKKSIGLQSGWVRSVRGLRWGLTQLIEVCDVTLYFLHHNFHWQFPEFLLLQLYCDFSGFYCQLLILGVPLALFLGLLFQPFVSGFEIFVLLLEFLVFGV